MNLENVKSLADLAFKAKSNKYYKQLLILSYTYDQGIEKWDKFKGKPITDEAFNRALAYYSKHVKNDCINCGSVCNNIMRFASYVIEEKPIKKKPAKTSTKKTSLKVRIKNKKSSSRPTPSRLPDGFELRLTTSAVRRAAQINTP
jgi:hypothetical protein